MSNIEKQGGTMSGQIVPGNKRVAAGFQDFMRTPVKPVNVPANGTNASAAAPKVK
jgi:hypothetical protein